MKEKCAATKKNGEPCKSWAMANGFCRRHGGVVGAEPETLEINKPEAEEIIVTKNPVEIEICGATTAKGLGIFQYTARKLWFPGSCLGTHSLEAPASSKDEAGASKISIPRQEPGNEWLL